MWINGPTAVRALDLLGCGASGTYARIDDGAPSFKSITLLSMTRALDLLALPHVVVCWGLLSTAQAQVASTEEVFERFSDRVVKVEVQETGSAAKAAIGSGFYISGEGHLITNYHVVSALVHNPDRYRAKAVKEEDERALELLNIDVIHDLALLEAEDYDGPFFSLREVDPPQGLRLFSMGHPLDLGLNIVEGTYNGFLKHALDKRINFTGSLNPGMSGGPATTAEGEVVGVNVASAGEQVSFLVPVNWATQLYEETVSEDYEVPESLLDLLRRQVLDWQEGQVAALIAESPSTVELGDFTLPTKPKPHFNCWADADREDDTPYEIVDHQCSTDDYIYVSHGMISGRIWFYHHLLSSTELNRFQFSSLYTDHFQRTYHRLGGSEEEVTSFRCHSGTVRKNELTFKTVFCLRRYRKLEGVYDGVFKAAVLGKPRTALETALVLSGITYQNAQAMVRWYMDSVSCKE